MGYNPQFPKFKTFSVILTGRKSSKMKQVVFGLENLGFENNMTQTVMFNRLDVNTIS